MSFIDVQSKTTITGFSAAGEATILAAMKTAYDGSAIAKAMFDSWISVPGHVITINFVKNDARGYFNTGKVNLDLDYVNQVLYIDDNGTAVKHTTVTVLVHELVHALTGREDDGVLYDSDPITDYRGAAVTYSNTIYRELGLPEQNAYIAQDVIDGKDDILALGFQYTKGAAIDRSVVRDSDWDSSHADPSNDLLIGGAGSNTLKSGDGNDFLYGNGAGYVNSGGKDADRLEGGPITSFHITLFVPNIRHYTECFVKC